MFSSHSDSNKLSFINQSPDSLIYLTQNEYDAYLNSPLYRKAFQELDVADLVVCITKEGTNEKN